MASRKGSSFALREAAMLLIGAMFAAAFVMAVRSGLGL